jgi:Tetratricopeptide repeat
MLMETRGGDDSFLRLVVGRSPRAARLRRRGAAIAGSAVFFVGLLAALGLTQLVLAAMAVLVLAAVVLVMRDRCAGAALLRPLRSFASFVRRDPRVLVEPGRTAALRVWGQMRARTSRPRPAKHAGDAGWPLPMSSVSRWNDDEVTVELASVAPRVVVPSSSAGEIAGRVAAVYTQVGTALSKLLPTVATRVGGVIAGMPRGAEDAAAVADVEGSRCNALGLALRRAGRTQQAAALHEAALLIFARLGNSRAEALAANALGVALVEIGDHDGALEQFERARALLHELGDRHWEGKVLANIGLAEHRIGRKDEAIDHLRTALANLSPQTEAYRLVERRLKLAS